MQCVRRSVSQKNVRHAILAQEHVQILPVGATTRLTELDRGIITYCPLQIFRRLPLNQAIEALSSLGVSTLRPVNELSREWLRRAYKSQRRTTF